MLCKFHMYLLNNSDIVCKFHRYLLINKGFLCKLHPSPPQLLNGGCCWYIVSTLWTGHYWHIVNGTLLVHCERHIVGTLWTGHVGTFWTAHCCCIVNEAFFGRLWTGHCWHITNSHNLECSRMSRTLDQSAHSMSRHKWNPYQKYIWWTWSCNCKPHTERRCTEYGSSQYASGS